jgi:hypothetical protein
MLMNLAHARNAGCRLRDIGMLIVENHFTEGLSVYDGRICANALSHTAT